jgi:drug/metabolite transporter (DMT)-like permease
MKLTKSQTGEIFIWTELLIWSLFPIITSIIIRTVPPILTIGLSTFVAGISLFIYTAQQKKLKELTNKKAFKHILVVTVIIGIIGYSLYTLALQYTSPNNIAIIGLSQLLFTIFYFGILTNKEPQTSKSLFGAFLILVGTITVVIQDGFTFNPGDLLVILSNSLAPFANASVQKARKHVSASTIMTVRSLIAGTFILSLSFAFEKPTGINFNLETTILILLNGVFLMGISKICWVEAIHRIDISRALSFNSTGPAFTMIFSVIILNQYPTNRQILGLIPMMIGIYLITAISSSKKHSLPIE